MRVWDIPAEHLCRNHLLGEHRELHAIWSVILNDRRGYSRHPEVMRWRGRLHALFLRHEEQVREMEARGYSHRSPLNASDIPCGQMRIVQERCLTSKAEQVRRLRSIGCGCRTSSNTSSPRHPDRDGSR
jgi:hypothetical protein